MSEGLDLREVSEAELVECAREIVAIFASNTKFYIGCRGTTDNSYLGVSEVVIALFAIKSNMEVYESYSYSDLDIDPVKNLIRFSAKKYPNTVYSDIMNDIEEGIQLRSEQGVPTLIQINFSMVMQSDMLWDSLSESSYLDAISARYMSDNIKVRLENIKNIVEELNLVYYAGFGDRFILGVLSTGDLDENGGNPIKSADYFFERYGVASGRNNKIFRIPLMDHSMFFKGGDGKTYLVSNPYLSTEEITEYMNRLYNSDEGEIYKNLKYIVLGKEKSFWNPGNTNCVIFYMDVKTDE